MTDPFRICIGWDRREPEAYEVARFSLVRRASIPVVVTPIKLSELRVKGLYWRDQDPLASTEFTYSRFLTPALAGFSGWALFCDCDFLWLTDIGHILTLPRRQKQCFASSMTTARRRRSKWMALCNQCIPVRIGRRSCYSIADTLLFRSLTPEVVNRKSGAYLHRLQWVADEAIGALPIEWNGWKVGIRSQPRASRSQFISPAGVLGSTNGNRSTTAISGARNVMTCCASRVVKVIGRRRCMQLSVNAFETGEF